MHFFCRMLANPHQPAGPSVNQVKTTSAYQRFYKLNNIQGIHC